MMEEKTLTKPSVAELAGMFKVNALPAPSDAEVNRPIRRRPPSSLKLLGKKDGEQDKEEKPAVTSQHPPKTKLKNSPIFEKLQANLALPSPVLLPSPKSPGLKLQRPPFSPISPCSPLSPTQRHPQQRLSEEETPASFEKPAEGSLLPSLHKSRARLSMKRRPPTRQQRKSGGEEEGAAGENQASAAGESPQQTRGADEVFEESCRDAEGGEHSASPLPGAGGESADGSSVQEDKGEEEATANQDTERKSGEETKPQEEALAESLSSDSVRGATEEQEQHTEPRPEPEGTAEVTEEGEKETSSLVDMEGREGIGGGEEEKDTPKSTGD